MWDEGQRIYRMEGGGNEGLLASKLWNESRRIIGWRTTGCRIQTN
jgi:hypothetical protein